MTTSSCRAVGLCCEYLENPIGIGELKPRLSWRLDDARPGARQTAYQIAAASSREKLADRPDLWDSGVVTIDESLDRVYGGRRRLASRQRVWWRVRVKDHAGCFSDWSEPAFFEMGFVQPSDWQAAWIGRPLAGNEGSQPCPYLRQGFTLKAAVTRARVYVSACGLFELSINGQRVGNDYFTPGWTEYRKRIPYLVYDVTGLVRNGANAIGAILGDGWYAGYLVWQHNRNVYGSQVMLRCQLEIEYADGRSEIIATDSSWKTSSGALIKSDIYHGEWYDARREMPGWDTVAFDDGAWDRAVEFPPPPVPLVARVSLPVRAQEERHVRQQTEPVFGTHIFDLGQNMVGWARIKVRAPAGQDITIRYAEMLNDDGTLYTANLRSAQCTDHYICKGTGEETYVPRFTFHGFRYVELTGLNEKPSSLDVTGVVLHSDMPPTGVFECADPLVNQLQQNITWGQRGNFLEVPTDCPQRDERLGWTGDAQVFIRTACFNRDVAPFFTKWCADVSDSQLLDGSIPFVVPDVIRKDSGGAAAWADAAVICPWTIHLCYGDRRILERQYDTMVRWVGWQQKKCKDYILDNATFGDWLAIDISEGDAGRSPTPRDLIGTAYFAYCAHLLARIAALIGRKADAARYAALVRRIKAAFNREFVSPRGRVVGDTQTGYLLALAFDLLPVSKRPLAFQHLVKTLEVRSWHLSTGFVGTPLLAPVLTRFGRVDGAYNLLFQTTYPSWLYPILQGATTMWERWNSYTKERGFGDVSMNSFNHYAYGAIGEWLYNAVAGIELDPEQPGYKHIIIRPQPDPRMAWARGELMTRHGKVACGWNLADGVMKVNVVIPPNTHATVILPGAKPRKVPAGTYEFTARYVSEKK